MVIKTLILPLDSDLRFLMTVPYSIIINQIRLVPGHDSPSSDPLLFFVFTLVLLL